MNEMSPIVASGCLLDVVANVLECDILVGEFELQLRSYIHFRINTFGKK